MRGGFARKRPKPRSDNKGRLGQEASYEVLASTAITEAVRERLDRIRRERGVDLAERLLVIGRDCAAHLKEPFDTIDHDKMLYDDRGLPK